MHCSLCVSRKIRMHRRRMVMKYEKECGRYLYLDLAYVMRRKRPVCNAFHDYLVKTGSANEVYVTVTEVYACCPAQCHIRESIIVCESVPLEIDRDGSSGADKCYFEGKFKTERKSCNKWTTSESHCLILTALSQNFTFKTYFWHCKHVISGSGLGRRWCILCICISNMKYPLVPNTFYRYNENRIDRWTITILKKAAVSSGGDGEWGIPFLFAERTNAHEKTTCYLKASKLTG